MTQINQNIPQSRFTSPKRLAWLFLALGIFSIIWPAIATIAVEQLIAALFIISGIAGLFFWWQFRGDEAGKTGIVTGVMALILGFILIFEPLLGAATLTVILVALLAVEGALSVMIAFQWRNQSPQWVWLLFSGLITLALAFLIVAGLPSTAAWALGLLFGVNLLSTGLALLALGQIGKS